MPSPIPKHTTIGELYRPAMEITDQSAADAYFERLVTWGMSHGQSRNEATRIQKLNLGYFAGYYDSEAMERVNRLFKTTHPIFGNTTPTTDEALAAGKKLADA